MQEIKVWSEIQVGDHACYHGHGVVPGAIELVCGWASHAWQVLRRDDNGALWIQEALEGGIQLTPLDSYKADFLAGNLRVFRSASPAGAVTVALAESAALTGTRYPFASTISLVIFVPLNKILGLFHRQLTTPFRQYYKCSDVVLKRLTSQALAGDKMGQPIADLAWVFEVPDEKAFTPQDLLNASIQACG